MTQTEYDTWVATLKVGDIVAHTLFTNSTFVRKGVITKITPKKITLTVTGWKRKTLSNGWVQYSDEETIWKHSKVIRPWDEESAKSVFDRETKIKEEEVLYARRQHLSKMFASLSDQINRGNLDDRLEEIEQALSPLIEDLECLKP